MSTTPAKKATAKKTAAKKSPAAKAPAKPATKATAKPVAKHAPKSAETPATGKSAHKPAAKSVPHKTPSPAPAPHAAEATVPAKVNAAAAAAKPVERQAQKPSKAVSRLHALAPAAAPLPPPTSRFADRFAPPRPPTRQMNNLVVDTPKHAHKSDPKLANAWKTKAGRELTEDELLAMPESEYMNDKQLDFFRARLQALKDDLLSNAGETTEHLREDTSIVPDPADRATIEEEHALELRTRDRERKLLKKISQSLGRIEAGDYGFCDETGEPIGLGRLIARPTATLSLEAQQRRELKQKMFGD